MKFASGGWMVCALLAGGCAFDVSGGSGEPAGVGGSSGQGGIGPGSGGQGGIGPGSGGIGGIGGGGISGGTGGFGGGAGNSCALLGAGARVCVDPMTSGSCQLLSGVLGPVADRSCPPNSSCYMGYCVIPPPPHSCTKASDCPGQVCNLFVKIDRKLGGFCANAFPGRSSGGASCQSDIECDTGFCADNGQRRSCLQLCNGDGDCNGSAKCRDFAVPDVIEGSATGSLKSCFRED